jgi:hypothetical protein
MSKYAQYNTVMNDPKCLKKVLEKHFKEVELHSEPQRLVDFQGRQTTYVDKTGDKAEIIVRRKHVGGAANDIGFVKDTTGNFKAVISAYDSGKHNAKWLERIQKEYLVERATQLMSDQEGELDNTETLSDGSIRMTFNVANYA